MATLLAGSTAILLASGQAAAQPTSSLCTASQATARLRDFAYAFNRGNEVALDRLFAPEPEFKWFSINAPGLRRSPAANTRATLLPYFHRRHVLADRLMVVSVAFHGSSHGLGQLTFVLRRNAGDYRNGIQFRIAGKAALDCASSPSAFVVMSLGGPGSA